MKNHLTNSRLWYEEADVGILSHGFGGCMSTARDEQQEKNGIGHSILPERLLCCLPFWIS